MLIEDLEKEFVKKSIKAFDSLDLNNARQSAEIFCKIIILKEFGETEGSQIILGSHTIIKEYSFDNAINSILFKNKIRHNNPIINKTAKSYLQALQNHGNLDSHNDNFTKLGFDDKEYGLYNLSKLIDFLYVDYHKKPIPDSLKIIKDKYIHTLLEIKEKNNKSWLYIKELTNTFSNQQQKFMLITDISNSNSIYSNLSNIFWSYIADFNKDSQASGLYSVLEDTISKARDVNILTKDDILNYSKSTTYWDFVNGFNGRAETISTPHKKWQRDYIYDGKIKKHLKNLYNGGISVSDIFILIFWDNNNNNNNIKYLFDYINVIDGIFTQSTQLIFCSTNSEIRRKIKLELEEYENISSSNIYDLSLETFSILLKTKADSLSHNNIILPALIDNNEATIEINKSEFIRYQDDLKLFLYNYKDDSIDCENYYKGQSIYFNHLNNNCDIERSIGKKIEGVVKDRLRERNNQLIYVLSDAGAGSTTIANRILWNIKDRYPSVELLKYSKQRTYEFLQKIYTQTNKPILIFADYKIQEDDIKNLKIELDSKNITYVLIYNIRFLDRKEAKNYERELKKSPTKLPFLLNELLNSDESDKFYRKLSQAYNSKQEELLKIRNTKSATPFIYNFTIFLENYNRIDNYIETRLNELDGRQKNRVKYLSLIQFYTGLDVTVKFLTNKIQKYSLFQDSQLINNLIIYEDFEDELKVKFLHSIVCEKILEKISGVVHKKAWKQKLADIGIDFLEFIQEHHIHNKDNEFIKDIVNRLFIKRSITTYDTDNKNNIKYYTDFIEDLRATNEFTNAREKIFKKLVEIYPQDRHYIAHLGRFYSVDRQNLDESLKYIDEAIKLAEEEGNTDSILYHMKGMAYFRELRREIRNNSNIDKIIELSKKSSECFSISRENDTQINNEYPFHSHAKLLLETLEYGKKIYGNIYKFIQTYQSDEFISNIIDNIENLISDFEIIRTKSDEFSNMKRIRNDLWTLQGDIGKSLQELNNLLSKNTYYNPIIKRNIVRLNLQKFNDNINDIPESKAKVLLDYLENNLETPSINELNSTDLLLWLKLIRHDKINIDLLKISEALSFIKTILDEEEILNKVQKNIQIIVLFYLQIIKFIQYDNGDNDMHIEFIQIKNELKNKSMFMEGKSFDREWLSNNTMSIKRVINRYDTRLKWIKENKFFNQQSEKYLLRCKGIIKDVKSQKAGTILYKNIYVHFVPKTGFTTSDINKQVTFYLSFSYDELSAWKVQLANKT